MTSKSKSVLLQYPILRGMLAYAIIWPTSSICQQTIAGKDWNTYDWGAVRRFGLYGSFFVAPLLYGWIRFVSIMIPGNNLRIGLTKSLVEQVSWAPFTIACFFFNMSLLEGKTIAEAKEEVRNKFPPTYKTGLCFWPIAQTVNYTFVPEKNRVPYVSVCSFIWTCFLAYMKHRKVEKPSEKP